jgi:hypothetical protein
MSLKINTTTSYDNSGAAISSGTDINSMGFIAGDTAIGQRIRYNTYTDNRTGNCTGILPGGNCYGNGYWNPPDANWWNWGVSGMPGLCGNPGGFQLPSSAAYYPVAQVTFIYDAYSVLIDRIRGTDYTRNYYNCNCNSGYYSVGNCYTNCNCNCNCNCGTGCFTEETMVCLADGEEVPISQIKVGDKVFNHDKTQINTVVYFESANASDFQNLYSPTYNIEPFATSNHPLYTNGGLTAVDPDKNYDSYPWLGKNKPFAIVNIVDSTDEKVYNLWVDGDGTYIVNGYGTTSIIGDGGFMRYAYEQGLLTNENINELLYRYSNSGKDINYGAYLTSIILGKINSKILNKLVANSLIKWKLGKVVCNITFKIVGSVANLLGNKND